MDVVKPPERDGQLRLAWGTFIPNRVAHRAWRVKRAGGKRCPDCGCTPESPCMVSLGGDDVARCVPAGTLGLSRCSACAQKVAR